MRVDELTALIIEDPVRGRLEIRKHLEGDLELVPTATDGGARHVELRGRVKPNSLLVAQEAVGRGVLPPPTVLSDRDESSVASAACPRLARSRRCSDTDSARPRL
jgi:hypothetical protein